MHNTAHEQAEHGEARGGSGGAGRRQQVRATARMTDVSKPTILKLLADLGAACAKYQDETIRNVRAHRVQVDEIWQFVYAKAKNVPEEKRGVFGYGDVWTWVAIDADSKLIVSWRIGPRDTGTAYELMQDLAGRLSNRVQLTTDGHKPYLEAVESAFGADIDYAMLSKIYGTDPQAEKGTARRRSSAAPQR
jgi:IS1 family transposase